MSSLAFTSITVHQSWAPVFSLSHIYVWYHSKNCSTFAVLYIVSFCPDCCETMDTFCCFVKSFSPPYSSHPSFTFHPLLLLFPAVFFFTSVFGFSSVSTWLWPETTARSVCGATAGLQTPWTTATTLCPVPFTLGKNSCTVWSHLSGYLVLAYKHYKERVHALHRLTQCITDT